MTYTAEDVRAVRLKLAEENQKLEPLIDAMAMLEAYAVTLTARSPKDYAIEFGGYLATAADNLLVACDAFDKAMEDYLQCEEDEEIRYEEAMEAAKDAQGEAASALRVAIYEFRKRRERAA